MHAIEDVIWPANQVHVHNMEMSTTVAHFIMTTVFQTEGIT